MMMSPLNIMPGLATSNSSHTSNESSTTTRSPECSKSPISPLPPPPPTHLNKESNNSAANFFQTAAGNIAQMFPGLPLHMAMAALYNQQQQTQHPGHAYSALYQQQQQQQNALGQQQQQQQQFSSLLAAARHMTTPNASLLAMQSGKCF